PMLDSSRVVESLPDALKDCVTTFAASAKGGFHRRRVALPPREAADMAIPANPDYPALNLAAAATIVAYEIRQAALRAAQAPPLTSPDPLATDERKRV